MRDGHRQGLMGGGGERATHASTRGRLARATASLVLGVIGSVAGVGAEPAVVAKASVSEAQTGQTMYGALQFDLGGGPVHGLADLTAVPSSSPPRLAQGQPAGGRLAARVVVSGTYPGGPYGHLTGTATIAGVYTTDAGCQARVQGAGVIDGTVSVPTGLVGVTATFPAVQFDGCGLASPQSFSTLLPPFAFTPSDDPPKPTGAVALQLPIIAPVRAGVTPPAVARATPGTGEAAPGDALARGYALLGQEHFSEALQAFNDVLARQPGSVEGQMGRGQASSALGNGEAALRDFEAVLRSRPTAHEVRVFMAELWIASGDLPRAQTALAEELRLVPDSALARSYVGTLQLLTHQTADGRHTMTEAARLDPQVARKRYDRGLVLTSQRQPQRAAIEFTSALAFDPPVKAAYFGLGLAMTQLGQTANAIHMYEQYIALEPSSPLATRARQEVARLKETPPR